MFYGSEHSKLRPTNREYAFVGSLGNLYQLMLGCWRRERCASRMQEKWSEANPTCGQCSITAFLVQDIFGGEVYGVPLGDGNYHCFNLVGDAVFDLTSERSTTRRSPSRMPAPTIESPSTFTKNVAAGLFTNSSFKSSGVSWCCSAGEGNPATTDPDTLDFMYHSMRA